MISSPTKPFWVATFDDPIATFTFILVVATVVLAISTVLLWWTTRRIALDSQDSGRAQADKMERSISEAARAAMAMEGVSQSMETNADKIVESVQLQRHFGQMQLRAYLTVLIGGALYQDKNLRFEARPRIINTGHTPARDVKWRIAAEIQATPLPADFKFKLPPERVGGCIVGPQQDGIMAAVVDERVPDTEVDQIKRMFGKALTVWGYLSYKDAFGRTRRTTFAQQLWWEVNGTNPDGSLREIVRGVYLQRHNRSN